MKKLYLIRHAKSDWNDRSVKDFDRLLNERGTNDARVMGKRLVKKGIVPDLVISSPASRAFTTAKSIVKEIGLREKNIEKEPEIYEANIEDLVRVIRNIDDKNKRVFLFGHNPALTGLVGYLTNHFIDNIPTCGVVQINFDLPSWKQVAQNNGKFIFFDFPKNPAD
ncbi:MAG: SixA phosphatase family protein [Bacteroidia bacterium]